MKYIKTQINQARQFELYHILLLLPTTKKQRGSMTGYNLKPTKLARQHDRLELTTYKIGVSLIKTRYIQHHA